MNIDFKYPTNQMAQYRSRSDILKSFQELILHLLKVPQSLTVVISFFVNWSINNRACDLQLDRLRKDLIKTRDPLIEELTNALYRFRTLPCKSIDERRKIISAFIENLVYKKLIDSYLQDSCHHVHAYDLLVYLDDHQFDSKRIDVGLIVNCEKIRAVQIFECKSFPGSLPMNEEKLKFLDSLAVNINKIKDRDEICEIYLLTLHDSVSIHQLGLAKSFYRNIIYLNREGIIKNLLTRAPLCPCKS